MSFTVAQVLSGPDGASGVGTSPFTADQDQGHGSGRSCLTRLLRSPLQGCLWGTQSSLPLPGHSGGGALPSCSAEGPGSQAPWS